MNSKIREIISISELNRITGLEWMHEKTDASQGDAHLNGDWLEIKTVYHDNNNMGIFHPANLIEEKNMLFSFWGRNTDPLDPRDKHLYMIYLAKSNAGKFFQEMQQIMDDHLAKNPKNDGVSMGHKAFRALYRPDEYDLYLLQGYPAKLKFKRQHDLYYTGIKYGMGRERTHKASVEILA